MPQIELMQADLPHTLYNGRKKKADDECIRLNREALARARERSRKRNAEKAHTLDEVFRGADEED